MDQKKKKAQRQESKGHICSGNKVNPIWIEHRGICKICVRGREKTVNQSLSWRGRNPFLRHCGKKCSVYLEGEERVTCSEWSFGETNLTTQNWLKCLWTGRWEWQWKISPARVQAKHNKEGGKSRNKGPTCQHGKERGMCRWNSHLGREIPMGITRKIFVNSVCVFSDNKRRKNISNIHSIIRWIRISLSVLGEMT